ncbi:NAD(+)/NADH kinase [Halomarina oriensis]|uniref:ATP-NAD kinase n=1 Tax=Halomarina oriensis TaxID=671145 RepID=A0A6B0GKJ9_9EURY|nr:NAD(+)/NADH kinase [Halomarina oriensis]MWG33313.1 hypothetical protein [Halomarina oriensis]
MNDEGTGVPPAGTTRVAVVGAGDPDPTLETRGTVPDTESLAAAVTDTGTLVDVADADVVVAVGDAALSAVAARTDAPVLVVGGDTPLSVPRATATEAIRALHTGTVETTAHPLLGVECGAARSTAVFDVTLVTAEPARISEYSVHSTGREVDRFRADGVVVATPLGSHGYAHAAGGPVLAPDADSLVTVPIAPFAIGADDWVVPMAETTLRVEREEAPVECFADTRRVGTVSPDEPVRVRPEGTVRFVRPTRE